MQSRQFNLLWTLISAFLNDVKDTIKIVSNVGVPGESKMYLCLMKRKIESRGPILVNQLFLKENPLT